MNYAPVAVAFAVAALLTHIDLDRDFYVPSRVRKKVSAWWAGFTLANGSLAALLYIVIGDVDAFEAINPWVRALLVGGSYLALVRLKLTTYKHAGQEIPIGLELIYESIKGFVYKRINTITRKARAEETTAKANAQTLAELATEAQLLIAEDQQLSAEQRLADVRWVLNVVNEAQTDQASNFLARATLARYILSGTRSGDESV